MGNLVLTPRIGNYALLLGLLSLAVLVTILFVNDQLVGRFITAEMEFRRTGNKTPDYELAQLVDSIIPWVWIVGCFLPSCGGAALGLISLLRRSARKWTAISGLTISSLVFVVSLSLVYLTIYGNV